MLDGALALAVGRMDRILYRSILPTTIARRRLKRRTLRHKLQPQVDLHVQCMRLLRSTLGLHAIASVRLFSVEHVFGIVRVTRATAFQPKRQIHPGSSMRPGESLQDQCEISLEGVQFIASWFVSLIRMHTGMCVRSLRNP